MIETITKRRDTLLKDVEILDKMLETGDPTLLEKNYWDELVDDFYNPKESNEEYKDGLSDEEKKNLEYI